MRELFKYSLITCCAVGAIPINFLLFDFFVPNPCVYDANIAEPGIIINTFYSLTSTSGYHPEPNRLNYILTIVLGGLFGYAVYWGIAGLWSWQPFKKEGRNVA